MSTPRALKPVVLLFIGKLILRLAIVAFLVTVFLTGLLRFIPGDPALAILGTRASPESLAALREQMGLNKSFFKNLFGFWSGLFRGDLGDSLLNHLPVTEIVLPALGVTLSIVALTVVFALIVGIPTGLFISLRTSGASRMAATAIIASALAIPPVVGGLLLLLILCLWMGLAPSGGWAGWWPANLEYAWVPSLALALFLVPYVVRTVTYSADRVAGEAFVDAAITRGISPLAVAFRHILPNSLISLITLIGFSATGLIGGAVVVEAVFGIPGLGGVLTSAVSSRDYPVMLGVALCTAICAVLFNAASELLYGLADPRIRRGTFS